MGRFSNRVNKVTIEDIENNRKNKSTQPSNSGKQGQNKTAPVSNEKQNQTIPAKTVTSTKTTTTGEIKANTFKVPESRKTNNNTVSTKSTGTVLERIQPENKRGTLISDSSDKSKIKSQIKKNEDKISTLASGMRRQDQNKANEISKLQKENERLKDEYERRYNTSEYYDRKAHQPGQSEARQADRLIAQYIAYRKSLEDNIGYLNNHKDETFVLDGGRKVSGSDLLKENITKRNEIVTEIDKLAETRDYYNRLTPEQQNLLRDQRVSKKKSDAVKDRLKKEYGIDPDTFSVNDLDKWANEHNFYFEGEGKELYVPKRSGLIFGKKLTTKKEEEDYKILEALAGNNLRKSWSKDDLGKIAAFSSSLTQNVLQGLGGTTIDTAQKKAYEKTGLDPYEYVSPSQALEKTQKEHNVSSFAGSIIPSVVELEAFGSAVKSATGATSWFAKMPKWAQNAVNTGLTFGVTSGINTGIKTGDLNQAAVSTVLNTLGGAAGSAASQAVGRGLNKGANYIFKKALENDTLRQKIIENPVLYKAPLNLLVNGFSGVTFAGAKTASTYYLYPKEYRPKKDEIARDMAVAFAFSVIESTKESVSELKDYDKARLDYYVKEIGNKYEEVVKKGAQNYKDINGVRYYTGQEQAKEELLELTKKAYEFIDENNFFGQKAYKKEILDNLEIIYNRISAIETAPIPEAVLSDTAQNMSTSPNMAINKTGTQPATYTPNEASVNTPKIDIPSVSVGDVFKDTKTGNTITVVGRDAENTVVNIDTGEKSENRTYKNENADTLATNPQFKEVETAPKETGVTETPKAETTPQTVTPAKSAETEAPKSEAVQPKATEPKAENTLDVVSDETAPVKTFAPEDASKAVKTIESKLVFQGANDEMREKIVNKALDIEKQLEGTDHTVTDIFNGIAKEISKNGGAKNAVEYWDNFYDRLERLYPEKKIETVPIEQMESSEALSPEDAQKYNIVVSNLKRKAEELGLLDSNFFTALQNVNIYNPTTSDRAVISNEFRRVFAGNTDPLVTDWLDAINVVAQSVPTTPDLTGINSENMHDTEENNVSEIKETEDDIETKREQIREKARQTGEINLDEFGTLMGIPVTHMSGKSESHTVNKTTQAQGVENKETPKVIRAKKADWAAHDVQWYSLKPGSKTIVAYSTKAASDLIEALSEDNPQMTISELRDTINYDDEAKKVLQAYIDSGFGDEVAYNYFVHNKEISDIVQPTETETKTEAPNLTDKCTLTPTKRTDNGKDIWVISLNEKISKDDFDTLREDVKAVGGYYSRFAKTPDGKAIPGFIFNEEPTDSAIKVFNDFFGADETTAESKAESLNNHPESDIIESEDNTKGAVENVGSQPEILAGESKSDGGGLRTEASGTDVESGTKKTDGSGRGDSGKGLSESVGADANRSDVGNDSEGIHRTDDATNVGTKTDGNSGKLTNETEETVTTEVGRLEEKRPSNKNNFVITNEMAQEFDNTPPSAKDNIEAIELLLTLENEGRDATADEKKILAKYKGWGGIDTRYMPYELRSRFGRLFDWEQQKAMQSSQNNAFFTPTKVIDAMYEGLKRMGFKGGNVLESSMGIGNFFGRMPSAMVAKSALTGVELESYTARIAQYLYPGATVINKPFQDVAIKNGSFDLVIGNVPFGQNKITYNKKKYSLHNYFILSSLDKVRDGGIVAVITSAGTLDSHSIDARKAIMDKADVVACYKLPEKVFSRNASTDVQSDLLILKKRAQGTKPSGDSILNTTETADGLRVNEYFVKHPENVLGTLAKGRNAWGDITTVLDNGDFYDRLNDAMKKLPKDLISGKSELKPVETIVSISDRPRFFEKGGKVYADDGAGTAKVVATNQANTVRDYIAVRDAYKEMLDAYNNDLPEEDIKPLRDKLTKAYDTFCKKHDAITADGKKKIGTKKSANNTFLQSDADYYLVSGLEKYDAKNNKFEKSALFEKDTLRKKKVTSVDSSSDALAVSLNESGRIDFARMKELTGKTEAQLADELKGEIVLTPEGDYVLTDIYLSGNIYEKLDAVKGKPEFKEQQAMLEKVIPTPKSASDIIVKLGANYIDTKYIEAFAKETFNQDLTIKKDVSGRWVIEGVKQSRYGDLVNVKYGCGAFNAVQLLEKILNDGEITATKKEGIGSNAVTVFDQEMTAVANQKANDIRAAFENWIFKDSDRRTEIVDKYNRTYNNYRPLDYAHIAEKLTFDSMDDTLKSKLYPHQKKGIARFLFGGNVLFAHGVGTGKTFEMIASVMEAKRMGIINKAAMVVPNNKVVDFKNDIAQAYPDAKVLIIDTANKKRQTMLGLVNSNDWDIVLIARTTFTKIPVSAELQSHFVSQQLEDIDRQIAEATYDRSVTKRQLKGLITQRDNLEQKLKDLDTAIKRDDKSVEFENLGIDCICVDEAHNYKSIITPSKLDIKGLVNKNNAQMANDMLMKLDYLRSTNGRIIFGTGTPITNTVSEIYNMIRMVRPDILEDAGIHSLDEWVNTFANIETKTEIGIDNKIKTKAIQEIRSFINVSEMIGMYRQFADIVFTDDVVKNLPKAVYVDVELEGSDEHKQLEEQISSALQSATAADRLKINAKLMTMADAAALDLRMLSGAESEYNIFKDYSPEELEYENSKINTMCDYVYKEYTASNGIKGTQIIFCDKGAGSGTVYTFNAHKDIMQKLIEKGIPEKEIVIIKNQNDAQLEELYDKVNAGEVRVLIGTSAKMAEGLNVQKRVVAIHHPTVTYKPSDKEQGDARGVRAGNINKEVRIYRYLQGNTFDAHKWQAQERKGQMIRQALRGDQVSEIEDIGADDESGAGVDAATAMAITSGNPLVKEKIDIDKEVARLQTLKRNYMNEVYRYQDAISKNPAMISQLTRYGDNIEKDIVIRDKYGEKASIVIKGKTFEKQTDANKALSEAVKAAPKNGKFTKLGTYNGFDIMFSGETGGMNYALILKGNNEYALEYSGSGNNIARMSGVLTRLDAELKRVRQRVENLKTDLDFAKQEISKPFEQENDLTSALAKQKDITYRYEHYGEKTGTIDNNSVTEEDTDTTHSSMDIADTDSESRWTTKRVENSDSDESKLLNAVKSVKEKLGIPDKSEKVNLPDIVKEISEKFGIPIAAGKVTRRNASGIYKENPETIRTRIANNLPTIAHELGHHLDKMYGLNSFESVKDLRKVVSKEFLDRYKPQQKNAEAVAEFVRIYLKNINEAESLCPEFYNDFVSALTDNDLKSLNSIAVSCNEYLSSDISERYRAAIVSGNKKEKLPFRDKWSKWYTNWVDSFHPQHEAVDYVEGVKGETLTGRKNAYKLATNSLNAHSIANFLVTEGFRDLNGNLVDAKSFIDCISMVNPKDADILDEYLVLRHSLEWIDPQDKDVAKKRVFADDTLENVDDIKKRIADIEKEHPEIKTAAENLYEYQDNLLKYFVIPSGAMSREMYESLKKKYPSYVPFYREIGKKSGFARGTFANQRSPIMRAKGSGEAIINPTESIIRNTDKFVKLALRNRVMNILAYYADTVEGFGHIMEKIPPDMMLHTISISAQKEQFKDALNEIISAGDNVVVRDLFDQMFGDKITDFTPVANASKRIVTVLRNGKPSYYQIHDEDFYASVAEISPQQTAGVLKIVNSIMQPMKLLITQNNPIFAATNAIRDFGTAYKLSELNNPVAFTLQYLNALKLIIAKDTAYKQYKAMGGGHSSELSANIDNISKTLREVAQKDMGKARRLAYSIFLHPVATVASLNDAIESVPRFMEFQRTLRAGGDLEEAIYNALDLTTNFARHGSGQTAKAVNQSVLFNNAAIQGVDKMARTLADKDKKKRYAVLLKWLLHALIMGAIGYAYNKIVDEEGYENLSSYKKNNFYNFAIGDGKFISLPKPRENALLDSLTERTLEYVFGNKEAYYDFGSYVGSQLLPPMLPDTLNPVDATHSVLGSTILGGLTDIGFNKDFKGTPIEGEYDKYTPSNERYTDTTSKAAYALGQTKIARDWDLSPKKIDHLISNYTGIFGQVNKAVAPMNKYRRDLSFGLRNKFISDSNYSTDVLNRMYENEEKVERAFNYKGTAKSAVEYEKNAVMTSYISGMNKAIKALPEDEQRKGRAYLLKTLNNWDYGDTASQKNMLSHLKDAKVSKDCIFIELPSSELEWTVDKQKYVYQMTPQEYHDYISRYLNAIESARKSKGGNSVESYEQAKEATRKAMSEYKKDVLKPKYFGKAVKSNK